MGLLNKLYFAFVISLCYYFRNPETLLLIFVASYFWICFSTNHALAKMNHGKKISIASPMYYRLYRSRIEESLHDEGLYWVYLYFQYCFNGSHKYDPDEKLEELKNQIQVFEKRTLSFEEVLSPKILDLYVVGGNMKFRKQNHGYVCSSKQYVKLFVLSLSQNIKNMIVVPKEDINKLQYLFVDNSLDFDYYRAQATKQTLLPSI